MDVAKTMKSIYQLLKPLYPNPGSALLGPHANNPLDVLILTILSQATNDTLSARAFKSLKASFGSWEEVMEADQGKLEKVLSVGGLQRAKSKVIREALVKITRDFRAPTLEPLKDFDRKRAFDYLLSLPGWVLKPLLVSLFSVRKTRFSRGYSYFTDCQAAGLDRP